MICHMTESTCRGRKRSVTILSRMTISRILRILEAAAQKSSSDALSLDPISTHLSYHCNPHAVNGTSLSRAALDAQGYARVLIPRSCLKFYEEFRGDTVCNNDGRPIKIIVREYLDLITFESGLERALSKQRFHLRLL